MIAEEPERPTGEPPRPSERDLLAERRARRVAESGDPALVRRADAAEATVKTLETHLASLQQRLLETEESGRRSAERLAERELELRRVKQLQFAEQQQRIEAERALRAASRRLAGRDGQSKMFGELQERVAELERRSLLLAREIDAERLARERTERALDAMRESHTAMAATVGGLRSLAASLRAAAEREPAPAPSGPPAATPAPARTPVPPAAVAAAPAPVPPSAPSLSSQARREEVADALAVAVERLRTQADRPSAAKAKPHKHSKSLIGRWRAARKQRHERG
ncbi:MAG TPA: hypothetical protein VES65_07730 [Solirubrobacteraceae bacterium]|nr:hypothetical protein [Solirubrobacteraceae bacterium]